MTRPCGDTPASTSLWARLRHPCLRRSPQGRVMQRLPYRKFWQRPAHFACVVAWSFREFVSQGWRNKAPWMGSCVSRKDHATAQARRRGRAAGIPGVCRWPDSNRHGLRHCPLKTACLPIPPHRHGKKSCIIPAGDRVAPRVPARATAAGLHLPPRERPPLPPAQPARWCPAGFPRAWACRSR